MILDHVGMTVSNYEQSKLFYTAILAPLGIQLIIERRNWAGYGKAGADRPEFWFGYAEAVQQFTHIAFRANSQEAIDRFYERAICEGATGKGEPKVRTDYYLDYYSAFIIDHDGHYIGAVLHPIPPATGA